MKKLLPVILLLVSAVPVLGLTVEVDGNRLPENPPARLSGGRVSVPLRAIFQSLGAQVQYKDGVVEASRGQDRVVLKTGAGTATVNSQTVKLDAPATVVNGVTYVPLRFVAQALGEKVAWDGATQRVTIGETSLAGGPLPDLSRLTVGSQAGVLKVWSQDKNEVTFFRGIDDRSIARLGPEDQAGILSALDIDEQVDPVAQTLMTRFQKSPQKEGLALLGVFNSLDGTPRISHQTAQAVRRYLAQVIANDKDPVNRRQALLALAVGNGLEDSVIESVLAFYSGNDNLWETFPVQQFFEYQAARLSSSQEYPQWKERALAVNSLYRDNIASYLP